MLQFKERLENALKHRVSLLGGPVWSQELNSTFLVGPFQPQIFCDSVMKRKAAREYNMFTKTGTAKPWHFFFHFCKLGELLFPFAIKQMLSTQEFKSV